MELSKQKTALIRAGYWGMIIAGLLLAVRFVLPFLLPFLLGLLIAYLLRPVAVFLCRHSGIRRRSASIVSAVLFYALLGVLLWVAGSYLVLWLRRLGAALPQLYQDTLLPFLQKMGERMDGLQSRLGGSGETRRLVEVVDEAAGSAAQGFSDWMLARLSIAAVGLPVLLLAALFTNLSSVLICADYERVTGALMRQIPTRMHKTVLDARDFMAVTLGKMLKAYAILTLVTFVLLTGGLWLVKVPRFWLVAIVIALLDLLPVIGSGAVLIPWGIFALMGNNVFTGVGLLLLWGVIAVVRQVLEPKIVGDQIGLHPLAAVTAMYIGLRLAGFWGLLAAPLLCLLLQHLQQQGVLRLYK